MATILICGVLLRSLLFGIFRASPPAPIVLRRPVPPRPVADRVGVLRTQFTTGVSGSRAPPVAFA